MSTLNTPRLVKTLLGVSVLISLVLEFSQLFGITLITLFFHFTSQLITSYSLIILLANTFFLILSLLVYFNLESGVNIKAFSIYMIFGLHLLLPILIILLINQKEFKKHNQELIKKAKR